MIPYAERNEKFCKIIELLQDLVFSNREIRKFQRDTRRAAVHRAKKILIDSFTENLRGIIIDGNETSWTIQKEKNTNRYEIGEEDSNRLMPLIRMEVEEVEQEILNTQVQKEDDIQKEDKRGETQKENIQKEDKKGIKNVLLTFS